MDNLALTILAAVILMALVIIGLAIGLLITGKSRLRKGCGLKPTQKDNKSSTCPLCGDDKICKEEKENDKDLPRD